MKVFTVSGLTKSGKTTTIEYIIKELIKRGYSVGSVKHIHNENFTIDTEGKNTYRHKMAGSELVTALSHNETDIMYPNQMDIYELLDHYTQDFVILEGVNEANVPRIATAKNIDELTLDDHTFAISGVVANDLDIEYKGIQVISAITATTELVNRIIDIVPNLMPNFPSNCCCKCGYSCKELMTQIVRGEASEKDCTLMNGKKVELLINDKVIKNVDFVDKILYNSIIGIVKELKGYKTDAKISIKIKN